MPFVKLALDENGSAKVVDGKPVYLDEENKEVPVDVPSMYTKIIDLGKEAKTNRLKAEEFTKKFSMFDDVEDVEKWHADALKAIETVNNFNEKDWLKAEKVESMKRQMKEAHEEELGNVKKSYDGTLKEKDEAIVRKDGQIRKLLVSNKFASCPLFVGDNKKTTMTPDVAEAMFGPQFRVEENNGELVVRAYYSNGDLIYSKSNPGEPADFNEGMQEIFDKYPGRDNYLRSTGGGSGAAGGGGGGGGKGEDDDLTTLQRQYDEAVKAKNTALAITLKNKIHYLRQKQRGRAA